mgnify:FL=1
MPGDIARRCGLGAGLPTRLKRTLPGISSADLVPGPVLLREDLAFPGEPLDDLGTGRFD